MENKEKEKSRENEREMGEKGEWDTFVLGQVLNEKRYEKAEPCKERPN